jgi:flagellar motor switch protein FliN/FliY
MEEMDRDMLLFGGEPQESPEPGMGIADLGSDQDSMAELVSPSVKTEGFHVENSIPNSESGVGGSIKQARFAPLTAAQAKHDQNSMDLLMDVSLDLSVELGRTSIPVRDVLQLGPGSILELDKLAGEPVDIMVNGKLIARGEVVVVDENFGIRVTEIANRNERLTGLA